MHLFYEPHFLSNGYSLSPNESKHCIRVLRHKQGDIVRVMDGRGSVCTASITEANPKKCVLNIIDTQTTEPRSYSIHMAVAPTKNIERFEWFLEKATEIGIDNITPIICDHSERKVIKHERLEKVIVAAAKQSLKAYVPVLNKATRYKDFIVSLTESNNGFIAHCEDSSKELLKTAYTPNSNVLILIGPEGDFTKDEIKLALERGCRAISLGEERLRTETAALIACATVNIVNMM
ncbi:16S rRNA (uracil1498-N3)-methyltransferase [Saccharicrinis carchari]|uniref:Ribosomal RNA small subunit methyltransferase E n=1 Tax=Saccharicrinis carchari TaxID=1168039 RepID=A0A521DN32_SACCC|nr:16S rRNA (uracil(1498)-N(3))-methyltransferase [Saccharicrinis carchari]SMO73096.1 16S rRNA (uracil1498-N3)-methyltransferase [Saccharicrinis carchari]